jgi:hypothetical protein
MNLLIAILTLALLAVVIALISGPLRTSKAAAKSQAAGRPELQAAREAKYREIRDTELDFRTGKLSAEDYRAIDTTLRAEAIEILEKIDALDAERTE